MANKLPTDKNGFIICIGDRVKPPFKKGADYPSGIVEKIISKHSVRIKIEQEVNFPIYGEYLDIDSKKLINLNWVYLKDKLPRMKMKNYPVFNDVFRFYAYKTPETKKKIENLHKEFEIKIQEYQLLIREKLSEIGSMENQMLVYNKILDIGDIVIWDDVMEGCNEPFLCKIIKFRTIHPVYSKYKKDLTLGKRETDRYEIEYDIQYKFTEEEFQKIINENKIKTPDEFIAYAKANVPPFEYLITNSFYDWVAIKKNQNKTDKK